MKFGDAVRASGLPRDSLKRFFAAGYVPQPKQLLFHAAARKCDLPGGPTEIGFGGARGPGKSHASFAQLIIDDCQRVDGLKCLFLRKQAKAAREAFADLRRDVLKNVEHRYLQSGSLELPNGSRVMLGHFRTEADIDAYLGLSYDVICIEESTQLTASKKKDIKTCLRTAKRSWRPRVYHTTNPGGVDHYGFKSQFIDPWRKGEETTTLFIPATVVDNIFINEGYRKNLEDLVGWKRQAWLEGDWDIASGQYFTNFRYNDVAIDRFDIPREWPIWASMDYGFQHPTAIYFHAAHDGNIFTWSEHVEQKQLPEYHASIVAERLRKAGRRVKDLESFAAGSDCFSIQGNSEGTTIAQQYEEYGITLTRASVDRVSGWSEMLRRFGDQSRGKRPTLRIFKECSVLLSMIPIAQHNPKRPEDVLKFNADEDGTGGDDPLDGLRYGIMERCELRQPEDAASDLASALKGNYR